MILPHGVPDDRVLVKVRPPGMQVLYWQAREGTWFEDLDVVHCTVYHKALIPPHSACVSSSADLIVRPRGSSSLRRATTPRVGHTMPRPAGRRDGSFSDVYSHPEVPAKECRLHSKTIVKRFLAEAAYVRRIYVS